MSHQTGTCVLVVALLSAGAGCGKQESGAVPAAPGGTSATPPMGSDLGKAAGQLAGQAKEQIASALSTQLQQQQQQVQTLQTDAKKYTDTQLDGILKNLDAKLTAVSEKINQIRTADEGSTKALQAEAQKLLTEAGDLFKQAKDRLAQLAKG